MHVLDRDFWKAARPVPMKAAARAWIFALISLLLVGVVGVFGWIITDSHQQDRRDALRTVDNLSTLLASDISRNIELLDRSIQAVVEAWSNDELRALKPSLRQLVLFDHSVSASHFGPILILDRYGSVMASSDPSAPLAPSYADREDFQVHVTDPGVGLFVSDAFKTELDGQWSLAFSRRFNDADGAFAGVVTGTLRLAYMQNAYRRMKLGTGAAISLFGMDGRLIAREPELASGSDLLRRKPILLPAETEGDSGSFQKRSVIDGVERIYGYHRVGTLPLFQYVAISVDEVYAEFWRRTFLISGVLGLLSTGILVLLFVAKREFDERIAAELKLQELASKDELTGLMNRRAFKAVLDRQWRADTRRDGSIGVLMIDVDQFKAYNDAYGHPAGDEALRRVGAAISDVAGRRGGLACRYGGEEFAVLLPASDGPEALNIADEVRSEVAGLGLAHVGCGLGHVTVSVGIACIPAGDPSPSSKVLAAADAELYRAKALGRNRSCLAGGSQQKAA